MSLRRYTRYSCATALQNISVPTMAPSSSHKRCRTGWQGSVSSLSGSIPGHPGRTDTTNDFNGTLRREVLNAEWFNTTKQAQIIINQWLRQYNHIRPHQALNMRPPVPETLITNGTELWG